MFDANRPFLTAGISGEENRVKRSSQSSESSRKSPELDKSPGHSDSDTKEEKKTSQKTITAHEINAHRNQVVNTQETSSIISDSQFSIMKETLVKMFARQDKLSQLATAWKESFELSPEYKTLDQKNITFESDRIARAILGKIAKQFTSSVSGREKNELSYFIIKEATKTYPAGQQNLFEFINNEVHNRMTSIREPRFITI